MLKLNEIHLFQTATIMADTDDADFYLTVNIFIGDSIRTFQHNSIYFEYGLIFLIVEVQT